MPLDDVNLYDLDRIREHGFPHDWFKRLRAEAPVYRHPAPDGAGYVWVISRYADVVRLSKDPGLYSSAMGTNIWEHAEEDLPAIQSMLVNMDPPQHVKYRRLVSPGFTPRIVSRLEPHIRELARQIVDRIAGKGECDFVREVAAELPLQVIAELMGVPADERQRIFDWSNRLIGFDDPEFQQSRADGKAAAAELWLYAHKMAVERRGTQREDLVSVLVNGSVDGESLSDLELNNFVLLLAVAGNETTRNLISGGMLTLIQHPEQRERLLADRSLLEPAVEEMLRWVTPVNHFRRTVTRDHELHGQLLRKGDRVTLWYPSANRDEAVFQDPDRFDVARQPNDHLAFGMGEHFCMGANLARLEITIMFEELLNRLPDVRLAGTPIRLRSNFINGIKQMPVRYTPEH
jgi:cholest-4-en-3-one 26-monooxygenase